MEQEKLDLIVVQADKLFAREVQRHKELLERILVFRDFQEIDPEGPWGAKVTALMTEEKEISKEMVHLKELRSKCFGHQLVEGLIASATDEGLAS